MSASKLLAALLLSSATLIAWGPALAATPVAGVSALQQRENRANHDRWARNDPAPQKASTADEEDDADEEEDEDSDRKSRTPVPERHRGELNGKLKLKAW